MRALIKIPVFIAWAAVAATVTADPQYQIFDLGVVQVGDTASQGFGASPAGVAVGRSFRTGGAQAFSWTQGGGLVGLPNLAGRSFAVSNDANDSGTVVGTAATTAFGSGRLPVIWQSGSVSQLPLPAGETLGDATGVNASGVAVGSVDSGSTQQGVIYIGGTATIITQTAPGNCTFVTAFGINDSGRIVGFGIDPNNAARNVGIVYDMGSPAAFEVGALPGFNGALAFAVGNGGHVVGSSMMNQGSGLPFIWSQANGIVAIPLATGTSQGSARGVNTAGWVVGQDSSAFSIPFLWDGTTTYRLADLLPPGSGWDLSMNTSSSALGISDSNVIVGTGVHNGETHAYAMVPVTGTPTPAPTPTTTPLPTATPSTTPFPTATPSTTPNEPHFEVSAPVIATQGVPFNITVTAKLFNNVLTGYTGTVHFTSTASSGAHLPPDSTLTNGVGTFSVTFDIPGNYTITARDTVNPSMIGTSGTIFVAVVDPPTPTIGPTATPGASPTPSPTPTLTPTPPPTPTPTPSASPSPTPPTQALNLSTRLRVQTGDNAGIGGFIITGTAPKYLLFRGIGPSLTALGISGALANPTLDLRRPDGTRILANNDWRETQETEIQATGIPPTDNLEAAIVQTLDPGSYTIILRGMGMTTGVGLVEIYDLTPGANSKLANISTRAFVDTGASIVIAGFIVGGSSGSDRMILRGIGPSLTGLGISNALADPTLQLRDANGTLLRGNNNWQDDPAQAAELTAAGLAPSNQLESGISMTLSPGAYTALLAGLNNSSGVGLVEVYDLGAP
jgi:hypothetical protein